MQLHQTERFKYLLSSLKQKTLTLAKTLPMTDTNYPIVYDLLQKQYNNARNPATFYWRQIQDVPS